MDQHLLQFAPIAVNSPQGQINVVAPPQTLVKTAPPKRGGQLPHEFVQSKIGGSQGLFAGFYLREAEYIVDKFE